MHYIERGEREGRRPHPWFDPVWYRSVHTVPKERLALAHFLAARTSGSVAPCAELFAAPFVPPYRDDVAVGMDPYAHYLDDAASQENPLPDLELVRDSGLLDENFYLINARLRARGQHGLVLSLLPLRLA